MLYPIARFRGQTSEFSIGFIDATGTIRIGPRFAGAGYFREGKASIVEGDGRSGFMNIRGAVEIPVRFRGINHFKEGICRVGSETHVGYIDHSGRWLIEPRFLIGMDFSEGRTFISDDGETFRMIDMRGAAINREAYERARVLHSGLPHFCRTFARTRRGTTISIALFCCAWGFGVSVEANALLDRSP